jgi:hypothetical protein
MSDARQAITAAGAAGATTATSPDYYAAQEAITRAETHLQAQEFRRARLEARAAKRHAAAALASANASASANAQHPEAPVTAPH